MICWRRYSAGFASASNFPHFCFRNQIDNSLELGTGCTRCGSRGKDVVDNVDNIGNRDDRVTVNVAREERVRRGTSGKDVIDQINGVRDSHDAVAVAIAADENRIADGDFEADSVGSLRILRIKDCNCELKIAILGW